MTQLLNRTILTIVILYVLHVLYEYQVITMRKTYKIKTVERFGGAQGILAEYGNS